MDCIALYSQQDELDIVRKDTCESHSHFFQYVLMCIVSLFILRDAFTELKQLFNIGPEYITNGWNMLDLTIIILNAYIVA